MVELAIALTIIATLVVLFLPPFFGVMGRIRAEKCLLVQRRLAEQVTFHIGMNGMEDGTYTSLQLLGMGIVSDGMCHCPAGEEGSLDDYEVTVSDRRVSSVTCRVSPDGHQSPDQGQDHEESPSLLPWTE